jgi:hypothetical protein
MTDRRRAASRFIKLCLVVMTALLAACGESSDGGGDEPLWPPPGPALDLEGAQVTLGQAVILGSDGQRILRVMNVEDPCMAFFDGRTTPFPGEEVAILTTSEVPVDGRLEGPLVGLGWQSGGTYLAGDEPGDFVEVRPRSRYSDDVSLRATFRVFVDEAGVRPLAEPLLLEWSAIAMRCPLGS